jgi:hypothetical protein
MTRIALSAIAVSSCTGSAKCGPEIVPCAGPVVVVATAGTDFVLAPGQRAALQGTGLVVEFERVVSDSRCPRDVQCVWAGNASVRLRVSRDGAEAWSGALNTYGDSQTRTFGDHELRVVSLAPAPVSTSSIESRNYRLTLRFTELPK